jgi:hypothetical protein
LFIFIGANIGGSSVFCSTNKNGVDVRVGVGVGDGVNVIVGVNVGVVVGVGADVEVSVKPGEGVDEPSFLNIEGEQAVILTATAAKIIWLIILTREPIFTLLIFLYDI